MDLAGAFNVGLLTVILTFFLVELFDASGTPIGVAHRAGLLDKDGTLPRLKRALLADATAIAAGTAVGGRTDLTAVTVAVLFLAAIVFAPLAGTVPAVVTAITMPFTFSITHGIAFGFTSYAAIKVLAGRTKELPPMVAVIALIFVLKFALF